MVFLVIWILLQLPGAGAGSGQAGGGATAVAYLAHVGGFAVRAAAIRGSTRAAPGGPAWLT